MRTVTLFLTGVVVVLCALEVVLRVLPSPTATRTGYYFDPVVLTYPANHEWMTASGWDLRNSRRMRSNNFGFATSRQFKIDPTAVALIGDSFVEASSLREEEGPAPQLESLLNGRPVYAMGVPGSNLLDYAERVRFAAERFKIRDFVLVLERGDVRQSLCGNPNVAAACLDRSTMQPRIAKQAPPSRAKVLLRESAAAQYLLGQLRLEPGRLLNAILASMTPPDEHTTADNAMVDMAPHEAGDYVEPVFERFIKRVSANVSGRLILVLDAPRAAIYRKVANGEPAPADPDRLRFLQLARASSIEVIDLESVFTAHISSSTLKLEVSPSDGHWNTLAISLVTAAIAERLKQPDAVRPHEAFPR